MKAVCESCLFGADQVAINAARNNHCKCLKLCLKAGSSWNPKVYQIAIINKNFDMISFLMRDGYKCDENAMATAAAHGNLELLTRLHQYGAPWDQETCKYAANSGSLECVRYCFEHGLYHDTKEWLEWCGSGNPCATYLISKFG